MSKHEQRIYLAEYGKEVEASLTCINCGNRQYVTIGSSINRNIMQIILESNDVKHIDRTCPNCETVTRHSDVAWGCGLEEARKRLTMLSSQEPYAWDDIEAWHRWNKEYNKAMIEEQREYLKRLEALNEQRGKV